jgi:nucleoside-diphosphate-sugar epimerase
LNLVRDIAFTDKVIDVSPAQQLLDMVHISDICSAYMSAFDFLETNPGVRNEVFGVFSGRRIKLQDLLLMFGERLGIPIQVNFGGKTYKTREVMVPFTELKALPNWTAKVSLEDGLSRFKR